MPEVYPFLQRPPRPVPEKIPHRLVEVKTRTNLPDKKGAQSFVAAPLRADNGIAAQFIRHGVDQDSAPACAARPRRHLAGLEKAPDPAPATSDLAPVPGNPCRRQKRTNSSLRQ